MSGTSRKVVVVGAGISGLSTAWRLAKAGCEVSVYEGSTRPGGTMGTVQRDGYRVETGPNGFLDSRQETVDLVDELGLTDQLEPANEAAKKRFTIRDGQVIQLPSSPFQFLTSPTMSFGGRIRTMTEGLRRKRPQSEDETVYEFARRRVGRECAERLVDAFITGVYAGDPTRLSAKSTIPRLVKLEAEHGSLTKALMTLQKKAKKARKEAGSAAGPAGHLTSFGHGMQVLIDRLVELIGPHNLKTGHKLVALERQGSSWQVVFETPEGQVTTIADAVVSAIPAHALGGVAGLASHLTEPLGKIPYAPICVVSLGFERSRVAHPLDGFGYVACGQEKVALLGSLWTSSLFTGRSPEGSVLIRNMVGGMRSPERVELDDKVLQDLVLQQLQKQIGVSGDPEFVHITRWTNGIPQYHVGHAKLLDQIDSSLAGHKGLFLTGNAYRGVSINDCVVDSQSAHNQVTQYLEA